MAAVIASEPLFVKSLAFVNMWLAELQPKPVVVAKPAAAAAAVAEKPAKGGRRVAPPPVVDDRTSMAKVAILAGVVLSVTEHPDSDHLFVEQIDLGEEKPRQIISGLRGHVTKEEFTGARVCVAANLEPRKMRGISSEGMVLCASTEGKGAVKLLQVPEGVPAGERIVFPGHPGAAEPVLKKKLAKCWDEVAPQLATDEQGVACFAGLPFDTSRGPVSCPSLPNATVS
jgi:methionine--tRNA ligase beta chain